MWYRIFAASAVEPDPKELLALLNLEGHFHGDDRGWFHVDLVCGDKALSLDRYTADEDGIRAELNSWAAFVEAQSGTDHTSLMERLIQTRQLFALERAEEVDAHSLCVQICERMAQAMDGVYQLDGDGFFSADGRLLLRET